MPASERASAVTLPVRSYVRLNVSLLARVIVTGRRAAS
jgi:hypothetical protein